jgi:hypothetical protein
VQTLHAEKSETSVLLIGVFIVFTRNKWELLEMLLEELNLYLHKEYKGTKSSFLAFIATPGKCSRAIA